MTFSRFGGTMSLRVGLHASVSVASLVLGGAALGNPLAPSVVSGDVSVAGLGSGSVVVTNNSNRAIVDWQSFSVGQGETTRFDQISPDAAILNRVTGGDISEIYGRVQSNGQVYLLNKNGILIGEQGLVDTNGFVASTLDLSDDDFLGGGDMRFTQGVDVGGGIELRGKVRSVSGGDIFLLSREVTVGAGAEVASNGGTVGIGAGEEILLRPAGAAGGRIEIKAGRGRIDNAGSIEGALAELRAAGGNEYALAINNTGVVRATGYSTEGGRVTLQAGGKVANAGKVAATRSVRVKSSTSVVNSGQVQAGDGQTGGTIVFESPDIIIQAGSLLDVSAALGGGRILVGGGAHGSGQDFDGNTVDLAQNAQSVDIAAGAVLDASATDGDAGQVIVWADGSTAFAGDIRATSLAGKGGRAEVSGKSDLTISGHADLRGGAGFGSLLIDPRDVSIAQSYLGNTGNEIGADWIVAQLAQADVTIDTTTVSNVFEIGGPAGNISVLAGTTVTWNAATMLTLRAENDITVESGVTIQHSEMPTGDHYITGAGGITLQARNDISIAITAGNLNATRIGSEFGTTKIVAGDTHWSGTTDATSGGAVVIGGGDGLALIGFDVTEVGSNRSANGRDLTNANGGRALNGAITVSGTSVSVQGGGQLNAAAQIGHGGARSVNMPDQAYVGGYNIAAQDITVTATRGDVTVASGKGNFASAQIGHGTMFSTAAPMVLGAISGDIHVHASGAVAVANSTHAKATGGFDTSTDGWGDSFFQRIGNGVTLVVQSGGVDDYDVVAGQVTGNIDVAAQSVDIGGNVTLAAKTDVSNDVSQIGHGTLLLLNQLPFPPQLSDQNEYTVALGGVGAFQDLTGRSLGSDITVNVSGGLDVGSDVTDQNGQTGDAMVSRLGHGSVILARASGDLQVQDGTISGNVTVTKTSADSDQGPGGLTLHSTVTAATAAAEGGTYLAAIGHGGYYDLKGGSDFGLSGQTTGGFVHLVESNILGAKVTVQQQPDAASGDDGVDSLTVKTAVTAGSVGASGNILSAQIGHGSFVLAQAADGLVYASPDSAQLGGDGGDVNIVKGTISDLYDSNTNARGGASDVAITSANDVSVTADVTAGSAGAGANIVNSRLGAGSIYSLVAGEGASGTAGGAGGAVTVSQASVARYVGNSVYTASGVRSNITVDATSLATQGQSTNANITLAATTTAALAGVQANTAKAVIGVGDIITAFAGDGGSAYGYYGAPGANNAGAGGSVILDLSAQHTQSDITLTAAGGLDVAAKAVNALAGASLNDIRAMVGHDTTYNVRAGDGGSSTLQSTMISKGGQGGDATINLGSIDDRNGFDNSGSSDITVNILSTRAGGAGVALDASVADGLAEGQNNRILASIGHFAQAAALAGKGGDGSAGYQVNSARDGMYDGDVSGGDAGLATVVGGTVAGNIRVAGTGDAALGSVKVTSNAGGDFGSLDVATIGHTRSLMAAGQAGGNAGAFDPHYLYDSIANRIDGWITLLDGNGDDAYDLTGVNDFNSTANEDGVDIDYDALTDHAVTQQADGVAETMGSIRTYLPTENLYDALMSTHGAIFFDANGNPNVLRTAVGFVENNADNFAMYGSQQAFFFGRQINGPYSVANGREPTFVDINADGKIDLVDVDGDGRLDVIDVDQDGTYDVLDGRQPAGRNDQAFDVLNNTYFTRKALDATKINGGWNLSDFSRANGGKGGDAQVTTGKMTGNITLDVGTNAVGDPGVLLQAKQSDALNAGGQETAVAHVGHLAFDLADAAGQGSDSVYVAGVFDGEYGAANGGTAGKLAVNANGGDAGSARLTQSVSADDLTNLAGDITINSLGKVKAEAVMDDGDQSTLIAGFGHVSQGRAEASNVGGAGQSVGTDGTVQSGDSPTELANGGAGGQATVAQGVLRGAVSLHIGAASESDFAKGDFSLELLATQNGNTVSGANTNAQTIVQVGHLNAAFAHSGGGGAGGEGQLGAAGGDAGQATISQAAFVGDISVDTVLKRGNGVKVNATLQDGVGSVIRSQIGHAAFATGTGGNGGRGTDGSAVAAQMNQDATGGNGGDVTITQAAYHNNILVEAGPNMTAPGANAIEVSALAVSGATWSQGYHALLAGIGNGGMTQAYGGAGGSGGTDDAFGSIAVSMDANSGLTLGTVRDAGRGGDVTIATNQYGSAGDIHVLAYDTAAKAGDGILIQSQAGSGDTTSSTSTYTLGIVGQTQFDFAAGGDGGRAHNGGDGPILATSLNGGRGGQARVTDGGVDAKVVLANDWSTLYSNPAYYVTAYPVADEPLGDYNDATDATASNIQILSNGTGRYDADAHQANTRVGHFLAASAFGGMGGDATEPTGTPTIGSSATLSAQGGAGGSATVFVGPISGDITVAAENSVIVKADHADLSNAQTAVWVGHGTEFVAKGGAGAQGGFATEQNLYAIYSALAKFQQQGFAKLTTREKALVQPVLTYFGAGQKTESSLGLYPFLDDLIAGKRDMDATTTDAAPLTKDEKTALLAIMGASGAGGDAFAQTDNVSGAITLSAQARKAADAARGVTVTALDSAAGSGMQLAQVGHQISARDVTGGAGGDVRAHQMGLSGNGGSASLWAGTTLGDISLTSQNELNVAAEQASTGGSTTTVRLGHQVVLGQDRIGSPDSAGVIGGESGSEQDATSNGYLGNGGSASAYVGAITAGINLDAEKDLDDTGIRIASTIGVDAGDVRTLVGHGQTVVATAGASGQLFALHAPKGIGQSVIEGAGGSVDVWAGDIAGDIAITTPSDIQVDIAASVGGGTSGIQIGHEQVVNATAGEGGSAIPQWVAPLGDVSSRARKGGYAILDGAGGSVTIGAGALSAGITLASGYHDVAVTTQGGPGAADDSITIGLRRDLKAVAGNGGTHSGGTQPDSAADGGSINLAEAGISGDILLQGDQNGPRDVRLNPAPSVTGDVVLSSAVNTGSETIRVGHQSQVNATSGDAGYGVAVAKGDLEDVLDAFSNAMVSHTAVSAEAQEAVDKIALAYAIVLQATAADNLDRYSANDQTALQGLKNDLQTKATTAFGYYRNSQISQLQVLAGDAVEQIAALRAIVGDDQMADPANSGAITQAQTAQVSGKIDLKALADGAKLVVKLTSVAGVDDASIGHHVQAILTSGVAGGKLEGGYDNGGVAGNGGAIAYDSQVSGDIGLTGDTLVTTIGGLGADIFRVGHYAGLTATAFQSDIGDKLANGGDITLGQSVTGKVSLTANHFSTSDKGVDGRLGTNPTATAEINLGHKVGAVATSLADKGLGIDTSLKNRGGDISVTQDVESPVSISANLDNLGAGGDLIIGNSGVGTGTITIGANTDTRAISGRVDDGDNITLQQTVSGDLQVSGVEDLSISAGTGSGAHSLTLGHWARQSGQSGRVDFSKANDFGGLVQATQTLGGNITLQAAGGMAIDPSSKAATTTQIGHKAVQIAQTAGDGLEAVPSVVDVNARQSVTSNISLTAMALSAKASAAAHSVTVGTVVSQDLQADDLNSVVQGDSAVVGNVTLTALSGSPSPDATRTTPVVTTDADDTLVLWPYDGILISQDTGGTTQIGHSSNNLVNGTAQIADGAAQGTQTINGGVFLQSAGNLKVDMIDGSARIGHFIAQNADLLDHPLVVALPPGLGAATSTLTQTVTDKSTISLTAANNLTLQSEGGAGIVVGHVSPDTNASQYDGKTIITPQTLMGDITLTAGYLEGAGDYLADGSVGTGGDLSIFAGAGTVRVGHVHADALGTAKNATQTVDADILIKAVADLHVVSAGGAAAIGHAHYDLANVDSDAGNTTPDATTRNRLKGLTTIGAVQYAASLGADGKVANAFVFDGASVNSGYAEVGGKLRFFSAARENLMVGTGTQFNDHGTGDTAKERAAGSALPVFSGDGGNLHEESFTRLSTTAAYSAAKAGLGNFVFYYGEAATTDVPRHLIPRFVNAFNFPGVTVTLRPNGQGGALINLSGANLAAFVESDSFTLACAELGVTGACTELRRQVRDGVQEPGTVLDNLPDADGPATRDVFDPTAVDSLGFVPGPVRFSLGRTQRAALTEVRLGGGAMADEQTLAALLQSRLLAGVN